jgi:serine/threonine-protein kinase HipA
MTLEIHPYIYGHRIGTLLLDGGRVFFEYDEAFRASGLEISPLKLPLQSTRLYTNEDDVAYYGGLAGVFHDSLPDRFGTRVIERYFESKNIPPHDLTIIQKLMFVGHKGMGAIHYEPSENLLEHHAVREAIELDIFARNAQKIIEGESLEVVDGVLAFMDSAASAGGARAKALVGFDPASESMIYGLKDTLPEPYEHWLIKFDAPAEHGGSSGYTRLEYLYMQMAAEAGMAVPPLALLAHGDLTHFMIQRFDRVGDERRHLHSFAGMTHANINAPGHGSYDNLLRLTRHITGSQAEVEELYRRMVFNIIARNQDDHAKNFSFLMDRQGRWRIAPAYDITYANGRGHTQEHQLTLKGRRSGFDRKMLLEFAQEQSIRRQDAEAIIGQIQEVVSTFGQRAKELEIDQLTIERITQEHLLKL